MHRVVRGLPTGGQGSKVYVLCAEPKEYQHFRPGIWPGGSGARSRIGDRGDREIVYVPNLYVPFPAPREKFEKKNKVCVRFLASSFGVPWTWYIDPFRASRPKWGRKRPKNGFWPHLKNGGKMARKMRKMARKMENIARKWNFGPFFPFSGPCFPHFSGEAKIHFSAIFVPISARRPEMDLYTTSRGFLAPSSH